MCVHYLFQWMESKEIDQFHKRIVHKKWKLPHLHTLKPSYDFLLSDE